MARVGRLRTTSEADNGLTGLDKAAVKPSPYMPLVYRDLHQVGMRLPMGRSLTESQLTTRRLDEESIGQCRFLRIQRERAA